MKMSRSLPALVAGVVAAFAAGGANGGDLAITSFGGNGELTFGEIEHAASYRVEWAPAPGGPWTNSWDALADIAATGSGVVTCTVPMFYRVVAVTNAPAPVGMALIPGGTNSGTDPEFGAYSLTVDAFYMDATEVTKAKWDEVYAWAVTHGYSFDNVGSGKGANHPVHTMNWYDCVKWCNARSEKEGRTPCYTVSGAVYKTGQSSPACNFSANGYRLPTNDEWEYAARGGLSGRRFPWGDTITHSQANYYSSSSYGYDVSITRGYHPDYDDGGYPYTSPVGAFAANAYGLYDMAGNVWEWCNDPSGSYRCIRGGSWDLNAFFLRCGYEFWRNPDYSDSYSGFRAVCR